jgi:hypothetical protein
MRRNRLPLIVLALVACSGRSRPPNRLQRVDTVALGVPPEVSAQVPECEPLSDIETLNQQEAFIDTEGLRPASVSWDVQSDGVGLAFQSHRDVIFAWSEGRGTRTARLRNVVPKGADGENAGAWSANPSLARGARGVAASMFDGKQTRLLWLHRDRVEMKSTLPVFAKSTLVSDTSGFVLFWRSGNESRAERLDGDLKAVGSERFTDLRDAVPVRGDGPAEAIALSRIDCGGSSCIQVFRLTRSSGRVALGAPMSEPEYGSSAVAATTRTGPRTLALVRSDSGSRLLVHDGKATTALPVVEWYDNSIEASSLAAADRGFAVIGTPSRDGESATLALASWSGLPECYQHVSDPDGFIVSATLRIQGDHVEVYWLSSRKSVVSWRRARVPWAKSSSR